MTDLDKDQHWSQTYLRKPKRQVTISRIDMLLIMYTKYQLEEISFLELKDRVRAINALSEWVSGFSVMDEAYARFRYGGLLTSKVNSEFLRLFQQKKFQNIDQHGVDDFPKILEKSMPTNEKEEL